MKNSPQQTKIIATIGPATESPEMLEKMVLAGMSIARINMSHASHDQMRRIVTALREISDRLGLTVSTLMDTQGPAIRTGDLETKLDLKAGDVIALTVRGEQSEEEYSVDVNYDDLVNDINVGHVVMVDNGEIQLRVLEKKRNQLRCEVLTPGLLGSRRHINLPGVRVNLPGLTEKDLRDIEVGIEAEVDFIAMSFVRDADDVMKLKGILDFHNGKQQVIAKLEDQEGIRNLDEIISAADGIMVARGDLGIECPFEELPIIQRRIVKHCIRVGKPVIVATHMMESMISNPTPTRAEITDVANAVFEQADAIMLSGETTVGKYPLKCVEIMGRVARRIEQSGGAGYSEQAQLDTEYAKLVKSACVLAGDINAAALVVFTRSGGMARNAAWMRPHAIPIYAMAEERTLLRQLPLYRAVHPFSMTLGDDPTTNVRDAMKLLKSRDYLESGDQIVAVTEVKQGGKIIDIIQMERVD